MTFINDIETDARNGLIAAWRYLSYLDDEKRFLLHAIKPDWRKTRLFIPLDSQVGCLNPSGPQGDPISRAPEVLSFLGMDPYADDDWVDMIGVDISQIPIIGEAGEKRKPRAG